MERTNDPVYLTYYMMDWKNARQTPSEDRCVTCTKFMLQVQPITSKMGVIYEGRVCHSCKLLFWIKKD